jgi:hypothetical protein
MKHNGKEGNIHAADYVPVLLYPILGTCGFSPQKRNRKPQEKIPIQHNIYWKPLCANQHK